MTTTKLQRTALGLPPKERLGLAEALWNSLEEESVPIPDWQKRLLDERIAADEMNPEAGTPWPEVKEEILKSL